MSSSFPKFVEEASGIVKVIFTNFTGELTAKEIIGLKKYVECPISKQESSTSTWAGNPSPLGCVRPAGRSQNLEDITEKKPSISVANKSSNTVDPRFVNESDGDNDDDDDDDDTAPPADRSRNLLDESEETPDPDDEDSTVPELQKTSGGLNISVALDDDIEFEEGLSQQVHGYGGY